MKPTLYKKYDPAHRCKCGCPWFYVPGGKCVTCALLAGFRPKPIVHTMEEPIDIDWNKIKEENAMAGVSYKNSP